MALPPPCPTPTRHPNAPPVSKSATPPVAASFSWASCRCPSVLPFPLQLCRHSERSEESHPVNFRADRAAKNLWSAVALPPPCPTPTRHPNAPPVSKSATPPVAASFSWASCRCPSVLPFPLRLCRHSERSEESHPVNFRAVRSAKNLWSAVALPPPCPTPTRHPNAPPVSKSATPPVAASFSWASCRCLVLPFPLQFMS